MVTMIKHVLLLLFSSLLPSILTADPPVGSPLPSILTVDPPVGSPLQSPAGCSDFIRTSCTTTLYPDLCFSSVSPFANSIHNDSNRLARVAISLSLSNTLHVTSYLKNTYGSYFDHRGGGPNHQPVGLAGVLKDCYENLKDAVDEIRDSMKQMKELVSASSDSFEFQMSNVKTWLSAALTDQYTCTDGFEDFHVDESIRDDVSSRVYYVKKLTSNALALVNRYADKAIIIH